MSKQDELCKTIIEALAVAQSDADTDCPIVADIRRQLADAELTSQRLQAGLITREQAALEGLQIIDDPQEALRLGCPRELVADMLTGSN